jgi:prepilin signal peptidase PulO-like enzyme (type II secretory pathway)
LFLFAFIAGVALGGLLNVVIYRLPRLVPTAESTLSPPPPLVDGQLPPPDLSPPSREGEERLAAIPALDPDNSALSTRHSALSRQSSALHCTQSGEALTWRDSVPLLGWLGQMGRCRHCGKRLPRAFLLVEIFTGLTFAAAWIDFGVSPQFYIYSLFALLLIVTMVIDWQHHDLYTIVLLAGAVLALGGALLNPALDLSAALLGAAVGGGTLLVFYFIARLAYGEEALAFGDVELALMLGLMVGYPAILGPLLLGPLIAGAAGVALVFVRRKGMHDYIPIGASFCFATICALLLRDQLWHTLPLDNLTYWLGVMTDNIGKWLGGLISAR